MTSRTENIELALGHGPKHLDGVEADTKNVTKDKQEDKQSPRLNEIIRLLKQNASLSEIAVSLGVSRRTITRDTTWLKDNGYLMHEGPVRNGKWIIIKESGENE